MISNLIKRYSPKISDNFILKTIPSVDNHNTYEIDSVDGKIQLSGDCYISLAMAYYRYMKDYCNVCMTHCGDFSFDVDTAPLPDKKITKVILQDKRIAMTPAVQSFTACFWTWERWEKEIDFMAMRGINMPYISVGLQAVLYYTLLEMNMNEDLALKEISGITFFDKQLSGYICKYMYPPTVECIDRTKILGKKIFDREVAFGMTPILQGYWGHVPYIFGAVSGKKLLHSKEWYGFNRTYFLKPWESIFTAFGRTFLDKQKKLLGDSKYFALDIFNENELPQKSSKYLSSLSDNIRKLHSEMDDDYTFIIPSTANQKIVDKLPHEHIILVKDELDNTYPDCRFVYGNKAHLGDRTVLEGSLKKLSDFDYSKELTTKPNLCGMALTSEGYAQNPLYYDLAFDSLTASSKTDLDAFLSSYAKRRWGNNSKYAEVAKLLSETVYSDNDLPHLGSVVCARPAVILNHTAPYDTLQVPYDNKLLFKALNILIDTPSESDAYLYDICDIFRQVLSNHSLRIFNLTIKSYKKQNADIFEEYSNKFLDLLKDLDRLLLTRPEFSIITRVEEARALTDDFDEKVYYVGVALAQITIYGHIDKAQLYDYAWKEWGGFIESFYAVRWQKFFELLAENFFRFKKVPEKTKKQLNGRNTFDDGYFYHDLAKNERSWVYNEYLDVPEATPVEDTLTVVKELIDKYKDDLNIDKK